MYWKLVWTPPGGLKREYALPTIQFWWYDLRLLDGDVLRKLNMPKNTKMTFCELKLNVFVEDSLSLGHSELR